MTECEIVFQVFCRSLLVLCYQQVMLQNHIIFDEHFFVDLTDEKRSNYGEGPGCRQEGAAIPQLYFGTSQEVVTFIAEVLIPVLILVIITVS